MEKDPKAGTTDQKPKWEGPPENRPRGYEPATDNPARDRDAAGHNLADPDRENIGDALSEPKGRDPARTKGSPADRNDKDRDADA